MRVVRATGNAGKIREFAELLGPLGFEFVAQAAFGVEPPEETGDTFEANRIEVRHSNEYVAENSERVDEAKKAGCSMITG